MATASPTQQVKQPASNTENLIRPQCREFSIRRGVFSPLEIFGQPTSTNASLLQQQGKLGSVVPGAHADLLVADGDPLEDIELLADNGWHVP